MPPRARAWRTAEVIAAAMLVSGGATGRAAANRLADEGDRAAFRAWFVLLADAEFERPSPDVVDCASLVRHAYREALRVHSPEWYRTHPLPVAIAYPDVRQRPPAAADHWPLFRIGELPDRYAEFADAATLVRLNTRRLGRDLSAARPGDLLYFRHPGAAEPDHLMVFVGDSTFDRTRHDWVVYHTGPDAGRAGEVRKASLDDLRHHPSPRWRPITSNPAFVGVFRLAILDVNR